MATTYGSNLTGFSSGGFVWAGEVISSIVAPKATLVGSMYQGAINYGQLLDTNDQDTSHLTSGASLRSLIDIAKISDCRKAFTLRSAVVNNNIINLAKDPEVIDDNSWPGPSSRDVERELGAEIVTYVIL